MFKFADIGPEKWLLVRHVPAGNQWHKAQDEMAGTSVYGTKVVEESKYLGAAEWSIRFDNINCPKFLFALGDRSKWLVATKDSVIGGWYANSGRPVEKSSSSSSATNPKWYRRNGSLEDPWVSTTDHHPAIGAGEIVYGENHFGSTHAATTLPGHQGANVFCLVDESQWTKCAGEGQHCSFSGTKTVKYGHGTDWSTKTKTNGVQCTNGVFGDPKPGQVKDCYYQ